MSFSLVPLSGTLSMARDKLSIPFGRISVEISTNNFNTISDIASFLKGQGLPSVKFFSLEGQQMLESTQIKTVKRHSFYISVNEDFFKFIPGRELSHCSITDIFDSFNLSKKDRAVLQATVSEINNLLIYSDFKAKDLLFDNIHRLLKVGNNEYLENKKKMIKLQYERADMLDEYLGLKKMSENYARAFLRTGFFISAFQFSYIGLGTYLPYSCDFIELQALVFNLGNALLAYWLFTFNRQEFSKTTVFDFMVKKRLQHLSRVQGFDLERFEEISEELEKLKKNINIE